MKRMKRLISFLLAVLMCCSAFSLYALAWSTKSHTNSANIILLETQRSRESTRTRIPRVTVFAPYDDHYNGKFSYIIPREYREAILEYPDAFRAGALGPDFYPDLIAGQSAIHPLDSTTSSGEWLSVLCDSVNILPKNSEYRKEALSFTLGCMLHYCGDLFGHDFINTFTGGSFPEAMDVLDDLLNNDVTSVRVNNVLSHMSSENYMDSLVNWTFYNEGDYLDIAAPTRFVVDTWIGNGNLFNGHTWLYDEYGELPVHFEWLIDWRTELYNEANEWRDNPDPTLSAAAAKYLDEWVEDQDRAIYALTDTFDRIAARLVNEKNPSMIDILKEELKAWGLEYGIYVIGVPDFTLDVPMSVDEFFDTIEAAIGFDFDLLPDFDEFIEDLIEEALLAWIGFPNIEEILAQYEQRIKDPSVQLDHPNNLFMKGENNFAEFKEYMDKYAEEQKILGETTVDDIINGDDGGRFDIVVDSEFEAFYNTMVMFKLILMGPDNFNNFVKTVSGKTPGVYNQQKTAYVSATGLDLEITTADFENAGTDSDIYVTVYEIADSGKKVQVAKKLLDISYYNDFEPGAKDKYFVELPKAVRVDRIEVSIEQESNGTAADFWKCEDVTITPVHSGLALIDAVSVGGNNHMDSGRNWHLNYQNAINARNSADSKKQLVTTLKVQIRTGKSGYTPGTDSSVYLEVFNGNTNKVWESVLLDKPAYNDFESGDNDTYIVPISKYNYATAETESVSLDNLIFRIKNDGGDELLISDMWITPYNGNLQLTDTFYIPDDTYLKNSYMQIVPKSYLEDNNYRKYSALDSLEYKTNLDSGLLSYIRSIDGASQWINQNNVLWNDPVIRKNVFFKLFKGFRPEMTYTGTRSVEYNNSFDMTVTLDAFWNGVRDERRNAVSDIADMPKIEGEVRINFIDKNGVVVTSVQKEITNSRVVFDDVVDEALIPGDYDVQVKFIANPSNPMYADAELTHMKSLTVTGTANPEKVISTIMVDNIKTPIIGDNISAYKYAHTYTEGAVIEKIEWQYYDAKDDSWNDMWYSKNFPEDSDVFEKGGRYRVRLHLNADKENGYSLIAEKNSQMTVFVNGKLAEIEKSYVSGTSSTGYHRDICWVVFEFTPMETPVFTVQPKGGEVGPDGKLTVSWETNFEPTRLTFGRDGQTKALGIDADATSWDLLPMGDKNAYRLFAFYSEGEFIVSDDFYITENTVVVEEPKEEKPEVDKPVVSEPVLVKPEVAENPEKPENAEVPKIMVEDKFGDVKKDAWYYEDVMLAVQLGLINGKGSDSTYFPNDNLTYAEAIKLAACMHQFYMEGAVTLKNGTVNWYDTYVEYCIENGIINQEYDYNVKATRAGYMTIFANALPDHALKAVNDVPDNSIPDVSMDESYSAAVYKLYRAGILAGSDAQHNCKPLDNIKRSEVAAILSRMMYTAKRINFSLGEAS